MRSTVLLIASSLLVVGGVAAAQEKKEEPKEVRPDEAVKKRLSEQKVTVNLDETPLADALAFLHDLTTVNFVPSAAASEKIDEAAAKVSLKAKDLALKDALEKILKKAKLVHEVRDGVVWILTKDEAKKKAADFGVKAEGDLKKKLESKKVTFNFADTPLSEVVQLLKDSMGLAIAVSKEIDAEQIKVGLKLKDVRLADALAIIARKTGLRFKQEKDGLSLVPRD